MNDHELDLALAEFGATRVQPTAPPTLRQRIGTMLLSSKPGRAWLPPFPKWRSQSMLSATKFIAAGVIVALFGGFLLTGVLTTQQEATPALVGSSPSASVEATVTAEAEAATEAVTTVRSDILLGVDLVTEEVEPGVFRVVSDGIRDLSRLADDEDRHEGGILAGTQDRAKDLVITDEVKLAERAIRSAELAIARNQERLRVLNNKKNKTREDQLEILSLQAQISSLRADILDYQARSRESLNLDGSIWWFGPQGFFRLGDEATHDWSASDFGRIWTTPRLEGRPQTCDGIAGFDGTALVRYLRGLCVYAMDIAPDGSVWLQASDSGSDAGLDTIHTYVITPEAAAATE